MSLWQLLNRLLILTSNFWRNIKDVSVKIFTFLHYFFNLILSLLHSLNSFLYLLSEYYVSFLDSYYLLLYVILHSTQHLVIIILSLHELRVWQSLPSSMQDLWKVLRTHSVVECLCPTHWVKKPIVSVSWSLAEKLCRIFRCLCSFFCNYSRFFYTTSDYFHLIIVVLAFQKLSIWQSLPPSMKNLGKILRAHSIVERLCLAHRFKNPIIWILRDLIDILSGILCNRCCILGNDCRLFNSSRDYLCCYWMLDVLLLNNLHYLLTLFDTSFANHFC